MHVPPENKKDRYDDAYATGFVVASGEWGSDILTVAARNRRRVGPSHYDRQPLEGTRASRRVERGSRSRVASYAATAISRRSHSGRRRVCKTTWDGKSALLGYPIPDEFDDEGLGLATSLNAGRLSSIRKDALEVTLSIVPGESGAPVFIADTGEVVGVAESRFDDERSIGFALPIDDVKKFLHRYDRRHGF